jgi:predicted DNA-binding transcriptional regulator AlpA
MTTKSESRKKRKPDAKKGAETAGPMPAKLMLTYADVAKEIGGKITRMSLWRRWKAGKMPKPVKLGHRTMRFRYSEIKLWVEDGCKRWPIRT